MLFLKRSKPRNQPSRSECGQDADRQYAGIGVPARIFKSLLKQTQTLTDLENENLPRLREHHFPPFAMEELGAQLTFQRLDLMAYGAMRDVQLVSGASEAQVASRGFEAAEQLKRR